MINDRRRDEIFEQMDGYILKLDPTATGPRYFIDKIAICRNYLNSVSLVLSELQREKLVTQSELNKLQAILDLESAKLLSTDPDVRRMANIKDRESMVAHMLRPQRQRIDTLKDQIHAIDGIMKHVQLRNRELHSTMDAIKDQRRFLHIEVQTGAFYGDERVPERGMSIGMGSNGTSGDLNEDELSALIANAGKVDPSVTAALEEAVRVGEPRALPAPNTVAVALLPAPEIILDSDPAPAAPVNLPPVSIDGIPVIGPNAVPIEQLPAGLQEHLLGPQAAAPAPAPERPLEGAEVPPPPVEELSAEDQEAMRLFLGDPPSGPPTVEPSTSAPQGEVDDFSFLLDSV